MARALKRQKAIALVQDKYGEYLIYDNEGFINADPASKFFSITLTPLKVKITPAKIEKVTV